MRQSLRVVRFCQQIGSSIAANRVDDRMSAVTFACARQTLRRDRGEGLGMLEDLFRAGRPPSPPIDGRTKGELVALDINRGVTPALSWLTSIWLPWQGKTFDASAALGDNIFTAGSKPAARIFNPLYRGYRDDGAETYRAFAFRTYQAGALEDAAHSVLKIDYDLPQNPKPTIRRVLDELVQIDDWLFLGKAHVQWWSDRWQRVAFFSLTGPWSP